MKISALEEYGLRCMLQLARKGGAMTLPEISAAEGFSLSYAGKLLMILKKAGLVKAVRGRQGGYALAKPAAEYALKEILDVLGGPLYGAGHCRRFTGDLDRCAHLKDCTVRDIWKGFNKIIGNILGRLTLADLAAGKYDISHLGENRQAQIN